MEEKRTDEMEMAKKENEKRKEKEKGQIVKLLNPFLLYIIKKIDLMKFSTFYSNI